MKLRIACIAICALLLLPLLASAAPTASKTTPALSWIQLLYHSAHSILPAWLQPAPAPRIHAPAPRSHHKGRSFLVPCDAGNVLDPSGHCVPA
jgi:hypothetical protein